MTLRFTGKEDTALLRRENDALKRQLIERTEELLAARKVIGVLDRMKRDFIKLVSHELRTPLTSIVGLAEFMFDEDAGLSSLEDLHGMAKTIYDEGQRLARFVNEMVELLQWASGQPSLRLSAFDLRELAASCVQAAAAQMDDKMVTVSVLGEPSVILVADRQAVAGCLSRILDNAVKFSAPGGQVELRLDGAAAAGEAPAARVVVCDHGNGIHPDQLQDLGKAFTLAHETSHHSRGGGLGLAITREILRVHGGRLQIRSAGLGLGTEVTMFIPLDCRRLSGQRLRGGR